MKTFTLIILTSLLSYSIHAQINYDEAIGGDLGSGFTDIFTVSNGTNQWIGVLDATEPSNADTWLVIVPAGHELDTIHYNRSLADTTVYFIFDACSSGVPNTNTPSLDGYFIPPLGPGNYCIQILTDYLVDPVTWSVTLSIHDIVDPCADLGGDSDGDGTCDDNDGCPDDPGKTEPGTCGCNIAETDIDGDSVPDCVDNCPDDPNPGQEDLDVDGEGDACDSIVNVGGAGDNIIDSIQSLGLPSGLENSFIVKIQNALASCANGNENAAINELNAFINQVNAKRGNPLTDAEADQLIAFAQAIIDAIQNGTADCGSMPMTIIPELLPSIQNNLEKEEQQAIMEDIRINIADRVETMQDNFNLSSYPNPAHDIVNFQFTLACDDNVSFIIYDIYGKVISKLLDHEVLSRGIHNIPWNSQNLQGIMIGKLTSDSQQSTISFIVN